MARTPSTMLPLETPAPDFTLPDPTGAMHHLGGLAGEKGTLVMFICNHCPFVKHVAEEIGRLGRDCQKQGIGVAAIMPNDIANYPDDAPEHMATFAAESGFTFPYLYDVSQDTPKAYRAACTPDFYLFDADLRLYYRGQLDDSRPDNGIPPTGRDIRAAVEALSSGQPPVQEQKPSIGCNIKWKPGTAPDYFA